MRSDRDVPALDGNGEVITGVDVRDGNGELIAAAEVARPVDRGWYLDLDRIPAPSGRVGRAKALWSLTPHDPGPRLRPLDAPRTASRPAEAPALVRAVKAHRRRPYPLPEDPDVRAERARRRAVMGRLAALDRESVRLERSDPGSPRLEALAREKERLAHSPA